MGYQNCCHVLLHPAFETGEATLRRWYLRPHCGLCRQSTASGLAQFPVGRLAMGDFPRTHNSKHLLESPKYAVRHWIIHEVGALHTPKQRWGEAGRTGYTPEFGYMSKDGKCYHKKNQCLLDVSICIEARFFPSIPGTHTWHYIALRLHCTTLHCIAYIDTLDTLYRSLVYIGWFHIDTYIDTYTLYIGFHP